MQHGRRTYRNCLVFESNDCILVEIKHGAARACRRPKHPAMRKPSRTITAPSSRPGGIFPWNRRVRMVNRILIESDFEEPRRYSLNSGRLGAFVRGGPQPDRSTRSIPDAETSRPHAICLFADRRAERLQLAGRQAARLLCRAEYRAFRLRRRAGDGSGSQRPADHAQFRLARLWQPDWELAPV